MSSVTLLLCLFPLCVCLHCTVSSAYSSVHNLATHMCHLPHNCHLHSPKWARLCHTKVACHISCIVVAPALTETRRFGILFTYFTLTILRLWLSLRERQMPLQNRMTIRCLGLSCLLTAHNGAPHRASFGKSHSRSAVWPAVESSIWTTNQPMIGTLYVALWTSP